MLRYIGLVGSLVVVIQLVVVSKRTGLLDAGVSNMLLDLSLTL